MESGRKRVMSTSKGRSLAFYRFESEMGKPQILEEAKQYSCTLRLRDQLGLQEHELLTQVPKNTRLRTRKASVYSTFTFIKA